MKTSMRCALLTGVKRFDVQIYTMQDWSKEFTVFFFKQKTAYERRISDGSSDVCSSDLQDPRLCTGVRSSRRGAHDADPRLARRGVPAGRHAGVRREAPAAAACAGRRPPAGFQHGHDRDAVPQHARSTGRRCMNHYFATCPKGMEYLLRDELAALGASDVREALA